MNLSANADTKPGEPAWLPNLPDQSPSSATSSNPISSKLLLQHALKVPYIKGIVLELQKN